MVAYLFCVTRGLIGACVHIIQTPKCLITHTHNVGVLPPIPVSADIIRGHMANGRIAVNVDATCAELAKSPDFNLISFHDRHVTCGD
jgi:hypothetical protein